MNSPDPCFTFLSGEVWPSWEAQRGDSHYPTATGGEAELGMRRKMAMGSNPLFLIQRLSAQALHNRPPRGQPAWWIDGSTLAPVGPSECNHIQLRWVSNRPEIDPKDEEEVVNIWGGGALRVWPSISPSDTKTPWGQTPGWYLDEERASQQVGSQPGPFQLQTRVFPS